MVEEKLKYTVLLSNLYPDGTTRTIEAYGAYKFPRAGKHGMELMFTLSRGQCAVDFLLHTAMQLPEVREENKRSGYQSQPYGANICWHSPVAQYEEHENSHYNCAHTGGRCYYKSSGLTAIEIAENFIRDPETLWQRLLSELEELEAQVKEERRLTRNFS